MRKLQLDLAELTVESFATGEGARVEEGTVHGQMAPTQRCGVSSFTSCRADMRDACTCPIS